jgi:hypothetical protein
MESEGYRLMTYGLNDYLTADNMDRLINYNIENQVNNAKKDKHLRGIVGSINNDICELYLYNSSTPISNSKINPGLTVFQGDDVYVHAINGNLNSLIVDENVHNFERLFNTSFSNFMIIEGFQNSDDWFTYYEATIPTEDYIYKKYRSKGIRLTWTNSVHTDYGIGKLRDVDLSVYLNSETTDSDQDYIGIAWYVSDIAMYRTTSYLNIAFKNDISNYYVYTISDSDVTLVQGWNICSILKNNFTEMGSPDWSTITEYDFDSYIDDNYDGDYQTMGVVVLYKANTFTLPQGLDTTDSPTFTGLTLSGLTANTVPYIDASKNLASSTVTDTHLSYIYGLDQSLTTNSSVTFNDTTLISTINNNPITLDIRHNGASTQNSSRAEIYYRANVTVGNSIGHTYFYNDGTLVAQFICKSSGFYKAGMFTFTVYGTNTALEITTTRDLLVNGATKETSSYGAISIKQGTEPTNSTADQISLFATTGANCTLGLRTEATVYSATPVIDRALPININGTLYNIPLELA